MKMLVIHGPNLNMLGKRDPLHYGTLTLDKLESMIAQKCEEQFENASITFFQSNSEGALIDAIHESISNEFDAILLNLGAYSHYSVALHDALEISQALKVEVHLSDVSSREEFRKTLLTNKACDKLFFGKKEQSYMEAIEWMKKKRDEK